MDIADEAQQHIDAEEAMQRLHAGRKAPAKVFTHCIDCEGELTPVRLNINACRCIDCQVEFERIETLAKRNGLIRR